MQESVPAGCQFIRFGMFEVDLRVGELRRSGMRVKLYGQPFQVLAMLLEQPGELVTREQLRQKLWPTETFVDFDHSLNTAISRLREALSDSAQNPRFIETLPRRGYRFIAAVEGVGSSSPAETSPLAWVGDIVTLHEERDSAFLLAPADEGTAREKEKLEAARDDLGLALMISSGKMLLLSAGTKVRVLGTSGFPGAYEVRVLEGEHVGQSVLVPGKWFQRSA